MGSRIIALGGVYYVFQELESRHQVVGIHHAAFLCLWPKRVPFDEWERLVKPFICRHSHAKSHLLAMGFVDAPSEDLPSYFFCHLDARHLEQYLSPFRHIVPHHLQYGLRDGVKANRSIIQMRALDDMG